MWTPKSGSTTLDSITPDMWVGFRFQLLRNGHVVSLFLTRNAAESKCAERTAAIPSDNWSVQERISC